MELKDRKQIILDHVTEVFQANDIVDTFENRLEYLHGMQDALNELPNDEPIGDFMAKMTFKMTLAGMITGMEMKSILS